MKCLIYKRKKGITLVELLISLAILGIVLTGILNLFVFGENTFAQSTDQYNIQTYIRLANDNITKNLIYATDMKLLGHIPTEADFKEGYNYIYLSNDKKNILHTMKNIGSPLTSGITTIIGHSNDLEYNLEFAKANEKMLSVRTSGTYKSRDYKIDSEVLILNLHLGFLGGIDDTEVPADNLSTVDVDESKVKAIEYKTPNIYISSNLPLVAKRIAGSNEQELILVFNKDIEFINSSYIITNEFGTKVTVMFLELEDKLVINLTNTSGVNGKKIIFKVRDSINNIEAIYTAIYKNSEKWTLSEPKFQAVPTL